MSVVKEKLYQKAIESVIKHHIDADRYGLFCMECEARTPVNMQYREAIKHERHCGVKRLERILSI